MNYLLHGDMESLNKLSGIFITTCHARGLEVGAPTATLILIGMIDQATNAGIIQELQEGATFADGYRDVEEYLKRRGIPHVQAEVMAFDILSILAKRKKAQEASHET